MKNLLLFFLLINAGCGKHFNKSKSSGLGIPYVNVNPPVGTTTGANTGGTSAGSDAGGTSAGSDAGGTSAGSDTGGTSAGSDAGGTSAGSDTGGTSAGSDTGGTSAGSDAGGTSAGSDAGGTSAGSDTGGTSAGSTGGTTGPTNTAPLKLVCDFSNQQDQKTFVLNISGKNDKRYAVLSKPYKGGEIIFDGYTFGPSGNENAAVSHIAPETLVFDGTVIKITARIIMDESTFTGELQISLKVKKSDNSVIETGHQTIADINNCESI